MPIIELTDQGVVRESFTQIVERNQQDLRDALERPKLDATSARSLIGAINNAISARLDEVCQYGQAVHDSRDPDRAPPATLAGLARFRGLTRGGPDVGSAFLTLTTNAPITFGEGQIELHPVGDTNNVWVNVRATQLDTVGSYLVEFESALTGEAAALPVGASLVITSGPASITDAVLTDANDITLPTEAETPAALRVRMRRAGQSDGTSPAGAVQASLEAIPGISRATVTTPSPGKIEIIVTDTGVADNTIAQAIYEQVSGGVILVGDDSGLAQAADGSSHRINFTRPPRVPVYVWGTAAAGFDVAAIQADLDEYFDSLAAGQNVSALEVLCILQRSTAGLTTFRVSALDFDVPITNTVDTRDVAIAAGYLAELQTVTISNV